MFLFPFYQKSRIPREICLNIRLIATAVRPALNVRSIGRVRPDVASYRRDASRADRSPVRSAVRLTLCFDAVGMITPPGAAPMYVNS